MIERFRHGRYGGFSIEALARGHVVSRGLAGAYCVVFALLHILFFHDRFFDINRSKYYLFVISAYGTLPFVLLAAWVERLLLRRDSVTQEFRPVWPAFGIAALSLAALISTVLADEPMKCITGEDGRYAGLLFYGALAILYAYQLWTRVPVRYTLWALSLALSLCALLGVVNFLGWDPLGFYGALAERYKIDFLSTIGNINFFQACICVLTGLSAGYFLRGKGWRTLLWLAAYCLSIIALLASRSDGALMALAGMYMAMLLFRVRGRREVFRVFTLFSATSASACLTYFLCRARVGSFMDLKDSLAGDIIREYEITGFVALLLMAVALALWAPKDGRRLSRALMGAQKAFTVVILTTIAGVIGAMVYFSFINPSVELPDWLSRLRFDDRWGTFRGFVWNRTWRMYLGLPPLQKLFGTGPETLKSYMVARYNAEMVALTGLLFDNAHNEYLQYLFTTGVTGLAGYLFAVAGTFRLLWRRARKSASLYAVLLALSAYLTQATFNIAQPETTPVLFLLLAVACRRDDDGSTNEREKRV